MGLFSTTNIYRVQESFVPYAMNRIRDTFEEKGFTFNVKSETYRNTIVDIQRGGLLHQVVGMRHGLEVIFTRGNGTIKVEAKATLLENHIAGPAVIAVVCPSLRIPLLVSDGMGLIMDFGLDSDVMDVIDEAYATFTGERVRYCTHCGAAMHGDETTCSACGCEESSRVATVSC